MIKNFVKILELLGDRLEVCVSVYFHASFLDIAFKSFIDEKDYTAQSVCQNNLLFVYLYKSLPSTCFALLYNFLLMCYLCICFLSEEVRYF